MAPIYLHGYYQDDACRLLREFFAAVERQCKYPGDNRFHDPEYLAAKFVVWCPMRFCLDSRRPLDFSGVGVASGRRGDVMINVHCLDNAMTAGRPKMRRVKENK